MEEGSLGENLNNSSNLEKALAWTEQGLSSGTEDHFVQFVCEVLIK